MGRGFSFPATGRESRFLHTRPDPYLSLPPTTCRHCLARSIRAALHRHDRHLRIHTVVPPRVSAAVWIIIQGTRKAAIQSRRKTARRGWGPVLHTGDGQGRGTPVDSRTAFFKYLRSLSRGWCGMVPPLRAVMAAAPERRLNGTCCDGWMNGQKGFDGWSLVRCTLAASRDGCSHVRWGSNDRRGQFPGSWLYVGAEGPARPCEARAVP
jgi:hypothetical protein